MCECRESYTEEIEALPIPEKPEPVFYSTNDYETARNGNTGGFAYRDNGKS